jgi:hypothetical protein
MEKTLAVLNQMERNYPDISQILAAKEQRRRALAALPWEEKIAIVDRMRRELRRELWQPAAPPLAPAPSPAPSPAPAAEHDRSP